MYHNAYFQRIEESLTEDFPLVLAALGKKKFSALAQQFAQQGRSRYPSLARLSQDFVAFLPDNLRQIGQREWVQELALLAPDYAEKDFSALAEMDADRLGGLKLILHPSVFIIEDSCLIWRHADRLKESEITGFDAHIFANIQNGANIQELGTLFELADVVIVQWFSLWTARGVIVDFIE